MAAQSTNQPTNLSFSLLSEKNLSHFFLFVRRAYASSTQEKREKRKKKEREKKKKGAVKILAVFVPSLPDSIFSSNSQ